MRPSGRSFDQLRDVHFEMNFTKHAEGSCLVKFGDTHVLCTATLEEKVPHFLKGKGQGWITAEYGMLPRSTETRVDREAAKGKQSGRTQEIQRLIGRSLRSVLNLKALGEKQIIVDCDVLQADGGTRTAAITGGFLAVYQACVRAAKKGKIISMPITDQVAAVSCGIYKGNAVLDLDYIEDSNAAADTNFVMTAKGLIVEVQGTAEDKPFTEEQFTQMMQLAKTGIAELIRKQSDIINNIS